MDLPLRHLGPRPTTDKKSFFEFDNELDIDGKPFDYAQLKGKVCLVANVASCEARRDVTIPSFRSSRLSFPTSSLWRIRVTSFSGKSPVPTRTSKPSSNGGVSRGCSWIR